MGISLIVFLNIYNCILSNLSILKIDLYDFFGKKYFMSCFRIFDKCYHDKMLSIMYEIDLTIIHCNIKIFRKIVKSACIFYQIYQENQYFSYIFTNCISRVKNRPNWDNNTSIALLPFWSLFSNCASVDRSLLVKHINLKCMYYIRNANSC